uniref:Uncharacterized protein n=1 Tax=Chromera velia CCMP2878 TaxID=1169474 RepID=A0A0G4FX20_9ALVE|eukprot:Cvel_19027.t1-p1 / transcript=Cvel_19027.t1 / gene=Cvel_19027 / organism=Chromera_velia_CCMP2878 / gene_product=hypothetical protein / transcript_product=hypothetical protein / location=Cvel_scaffold1611:35886-39760(+) / protein_length=1126 / sequence_SO=supercontig / SO=protein_coding / is_pseudo=false
MIKHGRVHPDAWCQLQEEETEEGGSRTVVRPLSTVLIDSEKYDLAETLLEAGARMDLCAWSWGENFSMTRAGFSPLHALVRRLGRPGPGRPWRQHTEEKRRKGLLLLGRMAQAAKDSGCLDWTMRSTSEGEVYEEWEKGALGDAVRESDALTSACYFRDAEVVKALLEAEVLSGGGGRGELLFMLFPRSVAGGRIPYRGVAFGSDSRCAATLEHLTDFMREGEVNRVNKEGHTALSLACSFNWVKSAEVLLRKGAVPNRQVLRDRTSPCGVRDLRRSRSPLFEALQWGPDSEEIVSLLLRWKADPNDFIVFPDFCQKYESVKEILNVRWPYGSLLAYSMLQVVLKRVQEIDFLNMSDKSAASTRGIAARLATLLIQNGARCESSLLPSLLPIRQSTDSPLLLACLTRNSGLVRLMCSKGEGCGVDPNTHASLGGHFHHPVMFALERSQPGEDFEEEIMGFGEQWVEGLSLLQTLSEAGADLQLVRRDGHNLLSLACRVGAGVRVLEFLLEEGVVVGGGTGEKGERRVPLVEAADWPLEAAVSLLLKRGADPNEVGLLRDADGREALKSPLQAVMDQECPYFLALPGLTKAVASVAELLIDRGARCVAPAPPPDPLPLAAAASCAGAPHVSPSSSYPLSEVSPLLKACQLGGPGLVTLLCERGGANPRAKGKYRDFVENKPVYPVMFVLEFSMPEPRNWETDWRRAIPLLQALESAGADLHVVREDGHNLLSLGCMGGAHLKMLEFLLEKGVAVRGGTGENGERRVPLVEAADWPLKKTVSLLLKRGADPNEVGLLRDADGREALKSPLQAVMDAWQKAQAPRSNKENPLLESMRWRVEFLLDQGARVLPPSSTALSLPTAAKEGTNQAPSVSLSIELASPRVSVLLKACQTGDSLLVEVLCERGGAVPKEDEERAAVISIHLADRTNASEPGEPNEVRILQQWRLAEALLEDGARVGVLSTYGHWLTVRWDPPRFGSGSWLADLIGLPEARGPLLVQVIRAIPLREAQETKKGASPLMVAISNRWEEGTLALIEKGVELSRRQGLNRSDCPWCVLTERERTLGLLQSPLKAALDDGMLNEEWGLARLLVERGARLSDKETRVFNEWKKQGNITWLRLPEDLHRIFD